MPCLPRELGYCRGPWSYAFGLRPRCVSWAVCYDVSVWPPIDMVECLLRFALPPLGFRAATETTPTSQAFLEWRWRVIQARRLLRKACVQCVVGLCSSHGPFNMSARGPAALRTGRHVWGRLRGHAWWGPPSALLVNPLPVTGAQTAAPRIIKETIQKKHRPYPLP